MTEPTYPLLSLSRLRVETDGEGVTTLIAGAGCPLRCRWCINKEILTRPGEPVTARELYDRVKIDGLYFLATGGGVTFGGGESLLHADFIARFREVCGPEWRIYVETGLSVPRSAVETAAACADGFIVDVKTFDDGIYRAYTGRDAAVMKENLALLLSLAGPSRVRVRIPLIPEYNDDAAREATLAAVRALGAERTELFDYVIR